jgi:hypothetical protein
MCAMLVSKGIAKTTLSGALFLSECLTKLLITSIFMNEDAFEWDDDKAAANWARMASPSMKR